ncbi:MAG: hypothetical protein ACI8Y4_003704 [Candidatus Poriferisodalaceae bacterium]|jgi:hypothetical protein
MPDAADTIDALVQQVQACDVAMFDAHGLAATTSAVRRLERSLSGLTIRIGQRAASLNEQGAGPSAHETLHGKGQVSSAKARNEAKRAGAASDLPRFGRALSNGDTSDEHLDAVADAMSGLDEEQRKAFLQYEDELAKAAVEMPPEPFRRKAKRTAEKAKGDFGRKSAKQQRVASQFRSWRGRDGMGHFSGSLDDERFSALVASIDREMAALANAAKADGSEVRKNSNLAASALCELVSGGAAARGRAHVSLVVDAETAANGVHNHSVRETADGFTLSPDALERLLCDSIIQKVLLDERGLPVSVGRKYRTATDAQWVSLKSMYSTCAMCDRPIDWCQAHHIIEWVGRAGQPGGPTDLDNLVPLCSHHHHLVHEGGYSIILRPDRTLDVYDHTGQLHSQHCPQRLKPWLGELDQARRRRRRRRVAGSDRGSDSDHDPGSDHSLDQNAGRERCDN